MKLLRTLVLIVMAFAILPWGGVAAAVQAEQAAVQSGDEAEVKLSAPRRCRGGFLPCGLERWVEPLGQAVGLTGAGMRRGLPQDWDGRGQVHAPPREPPRGV